MAEVIVDNKQTITGKVHKCRVAECARSYTWAKWNTTPSSGSFILRWNNQSLRDPTHTSEADSDCWEFMAIWVSEGDKE